MKKKTIVTILTGIILIGVVFWFVGIRIYMPFSTIAPKTWDTVTIDNAGANSIVITDPEDINTLYDLLSDLPITTIGFGNNKDGYAFRVTVNDSDSYAFLDDTVIAAIKYHISNHDYLDQLYHLYDDLKTKYETAENLLKFPAKK